MQIIYLLPFMVVAFLAGSVCILVPRLRRYVLPALVAPIAFGVSAIVGMAGTLLTAEFLGIAEALGFNQTPTGVSGIATFAVIFWLTRNLGCSYRSAHNKQAAMVVLAVCSATCRTSTTAGG